MRYLVLTDIHANLEGLEACLADATPRGYDRLLVLGDIVGYGPDPNAVIDRIRGLNPTGIVRGNHDKVALGLSQAEGFHAAARAAATWMLESLTPDHREWLVQLPKGPTIIDGGVEICHGAPFDEDAYIFDELDARQALDAATAAVSFYGHTHFAVAFRLKGNVLDVVGPAPEGDTILLLDPSAKYLVNPGSAGQPRDGDPRAGYAIYDTTSQRIDLLRVAYDIEKTQEKMWKAGLPEPLARRLSSGR
jgi:diadenosine tetraphosphatase ApaH/serine/threonine PP2A family protein phosphatase